MLLRNTKCLSVAGVWWDFLSAPYPGAIKIFAAVKQRGGGGQPHTSVLDKHNTICQYLLLYEYAAMDFSFGSWLMKSISFVFLQLALDKNLRFEIPKKSK